MIKKPVMIQIRNGLEARPVALLVQVASQYDSEIYVESEERHVNAKSIMGMMTLGLEAERDTAGIGLPFRLYPFIFHIRRNLPFSADCSVPTDYWLLKYCSMLSIAAFSSSPLPDSNPGRRSYPAMTLWLWSVSTRQPDT